MIWGESDKGEIKFLVDLSNHTYISEKSHQEIIDQVGLNPSGFDNYLRGWVKPDGKIKIWVENAEDIVFRYWDQIKQGFKSLVKEKLVDNAFKIYAIVNRLERYTGKVKDYLASKSKEKFLEDKLGYVTYLHGQPKIVKGQTVIMLVNYRFETNKYVLAGTKGKIISPNGSEAKRLKVKWQYTRDGYMKKKSSAELAIDRRLLGMM